jgi:hypothetical protein
MYCKVRYVLSLSMKYFSSYSFVYSLVFLVSLRAASMTQKCHHAFYLKKKKTTNKGEKRQQKNSQKNKNLTVIIVATTIISNNFN